MSRYHAKSENIFFMYPDWQAAEAARCCSFVLPFDCIRLFAYYQAGEHDVFKENERILMLS